MMSIAMCSTCSVVFGMLLHDDGMYHHNSDQIRLAAGQVHPCLPQVCVCWFLCEGEEGHDDDGTKQ